MEELDKATGDRPMRVDFSDGDADKERKFTVLTKTKGPAILIEIGFMDNAEDLAYVTDPENFERICRAIARGILSFAGVDPELIPLVELPVLKEIDAAFDESAEVGVSLPVDGLSVPDRLREIAGELDELLS